MGGQGINDKTSLNSSHQSVGRGSGWYNQICHYVEDGIGREGKGLISVRGRETVQMRDNNDLKPSDSKIEKEKTYLRNCKGELKWLAVDYLWESSGQRLRTWVRFPRESIRRTREFYPEWSSGEQHWKNCGWWTWRAACKGDWEVVSPKEKQNKK